MRIFPFLYHISKDTLVSSLPAMSDTINLITKIFFAIVPFHFAI